MKRFLSILMLVAMGVTLVACGTTKNSSEGKKLSTEDANDSAEAFDWIEGDIVSLSDAGKKMKKIVVPRNARSLTRKCLVIMKMWKKLNLKIQIQKYRKWHFSDAKI